MKIFIFKIIGILILYSCSTQEKKQNKTEIALKTEEVRYLSDTLEMVGYFAMDNNIKGTHPGILVIHEWWGHNEHARNQAKKLAQLGYVAFAVDMYGNKKNAKHPKEASQMTKMVTSDLEILKSRFESALNTLKKHPNVDENTIGAIGYCFGGSVALSMANAGYDLEAVAAFHSGLSLPIMPGKVKVKAKILVANGADDSLISDQQIEHFKKVMDDAKIDYKYIAYEGAKHAFTNKSADELGEKFDIPLAYNKNADEESWKEMINLFDSVFK